MSVLPLASIASWYGPGASDSLSLSGFGKCLFVSSLYFYYSTTRYVRYLLLDLLMVYANMRLNITLQARQSFSNFVNCKVFFSLVVEKI